MQKVHYQKNTHTEPTLNLQSHQQQCPICQKVFKTKHLLTRHLSVVHTEGIKDHKYSQMEILQ